MVTKTATSQRVRWLSDPAYRFAGLVVVAAAAAVTLIATQGGFAGARHLSAAAVGIGAMIVISEFVPLKLPRRSNDTAFGASTLFAVAMLALCGTGMTLLWFAGAVAVHDLVRRKPAIKVAFNTAQFALAVAASGEVLGALSDLPAPGDAPPLTGADIPALMLAALVLSGLNHLMSAVVSSLASGASLRGRLRGGDGVILLLELLMVGFAPVVIVVADFSAWLLPVLVLPFGALLLSAREADRRHHDAMHDALTGLPNRTLFRQALSEELERCRHAGGAVAVLLLDLDRFKEINDALGHGSGDRVLVEVSRRLPTLVRDSDLVARLGGDEFGILVSRPRALEDVLRLAGRVRERLGEPVLLDRLRVAAGASIGVSLAAGSDAETLLRRADVAMYAAKERGVGVTVYEPADDPHSPERLQLLAELREGIAGGELAVHYQPKLSLLTDRIEGVEALVRWQHPTRGLLMPGDFLELAERSGPHELRGLVDALTTAAARPAPG